MLKQLLSVGIIGSLLLNQSVALAGRRNSNMVGSDGAFLRVECWSRNGKTTLAVNIVPNNNTRPIAHLNFDVEVGNRRETIEKTFLLQTLDANADKEIDGTYGAAIFTNGNAYGFTLDPDGFFRYDFNQRKGGITVSCN